MMLYGIADSTGSRMRIAGLHRFVNPYWSESVPSQIKKPTVAPTRQPSGIVVARAQLQQRATRNARETFPKTIAHHTKAARGTPVAEPAFCANSSANAT